MTKTISYLVRIFLAAAKRFIVDEVFYKASALTYYTLLSIVPILAVAFGIAKEMGLESYLQKEVSSRFLEQPLLAQQIINFSYNLLERTHGGILAFIGFITFIWTAFQLFSNVEQSLNGIWEIKTHRSYLLQLRDYSLMLILAPLFFIASSFLSVFTISYLKEVSNLLLKLTPVFINWILFSFIYFFMPNTKVSFRSAFFAGFFTGSIYQIVQAIYIYFQIGVSSYGAIYGSFAALPLFLVWLNMSWTLVLGGAEVAYQLDNAPKILPKITHTVNKNELGFWIACHCTENYIKKRSPFTIYQIAENLGASLQIVKEILAKLSAAGILHVDKHHCVKFVKNPEKVNIKDLQDAMIEEKKETYTIKVLKEFHRYDRFYKEFEHSIISSPVNVSLKEIVDKS